jgi:dipeptide/tripeptide permease
MCGGSVLLGASILMSVAQALLPNSPHALSLTRGAFFCALVGVMCVVLPCFDSKWIGDERYADQVVGPQDVQKFLRMLPTLIFGSISFNALYNSMQYWYQQQACQMDLRFPGSHDGSSQLAGSFFMIADCLGIVIATPFALGVANPFLDRLFPGGFRTGFKYGLGVFFGVASVIVAGALEMGRRKADILDQTSNCAPPGVKMSNMSACWMFLPFFLMGIGEIYTNPVLMHFAYTNSPPSLRTFATVLGLLIGSVSNAIFTVQISALSSYVPNDLNNGHLEYGYGMNVILGLVVFSLFVVSLREFEQYNNAQTGV